MSGGSHENRDLVKVHGALALALLLAAVLAGPRAAAAPPEGMSPAVPSASVAIIANVSQPGRTHPVEFTGWLNLTGPGTLQVAWVNFTFEADLVPEPANASAPPECSALAPLTWECSDLRSGSLRWTIGSTVAVFAEVGLANATIATTTYSAGTYTTPPAGVTTVNVRGSDIRFTVQPTLAALRVRDGIRIRVDLTNEPNATDSAWNVTVIAVPDGRLLFGEGTNLSLFVPELTSGSARGFDIEVLVAENATAGESLTIRFVLTYEDYDRRPVASLEIDSAILVLPTPFVPPEGLVYALAAFVLPILGAIVVLLFLGQRRIRLDEVFLMHRSGLLIHHQSHGPALKKDDDLVASMLVAIQEFVRDSFRSEATLDEFAFGGRHAAIVRGKNLVLAAIISRGDVRYLLPQMRAAVQDLEAAHGAALVNWDGRISRLDRAEPVVSTLLVGGYRRRGWTEWARRARTRFPGLR